MMRIPQAIGTKGSLKWIQNLVNHHSSLLDEIIQLNLQIDFPKIAWISPLENDDYAEYRDDTFLAKLGFQKYTKRLYEFWPKGGPQWDAFGKSDKDDSIFLVEAKANIQEIISTMKAKSDSSISKIRNSLLETQIFLKCTNPLNWEEGFYQYANRIAHLHFLRNLCGINTYLIFIYFTDDFTHIPTTRKEWEGAIHLQKLIMGLKRHKLQKYVADVFIDVEDIRN